LELRPSSLTTIVDLEKDKMLRDCENSVLMDGDLAKYLINLLINGDNINTPIKSQILMIFTHQIQQMKQKYIEFLKKTGLLESVIQYLFLNLEQAGNSNSPMANFPLKWLEAKIQMMKKVAIETRCALGNVSQELTAFLFNNKELILSKKDFSSKIVKRKNVYITSAINLKSVMEDTVYNCYSSDDLSDDLARPVNKLDLVFISWDDLNSLSKKSLKTLISADAVVTQQPDGQKSIADFYKKLIEKFEKDQEDSKYKIDNIFKTIIFFVGNSDFRTC